MQAPFDCIIIGAGPAGSTTAFKLSRAGCSTLVLEKEPHPGLKPCGGGVSPQIGAWLDFDLSPVVENQTHRMQFTWKGKDPVCSEVPPEKALWMVRRSQFDAFLLEKATQQGVTALLDCPVTELKYVNPLWQVTTPRGIFSSRFLVGADGARGLTRQTLGLSFGPNALAVGLEAESPQPAQDVHCLHLDFGSLPNGYLWNFPKADGQSIGAGIFVGKTRCDLRAKLLPYMALFGIQADTCRSSAYPICLWNGPHPLHSTQALLVGEAARMVDPLTAEGIRPAIASACRASQAILNALSGSTGALEAYSQVMQQEWGTEFLWAKRLAGAFYRLTALGFRMDTLSASAHQRMAELLCGALKYSDVAERALQKLVPW